MQEISPNLLDAFTGTFRPIHVVDAWYDGELIYGDVPIKSGQVTLDATRGVTGACSLEVVSEDEALLPTNWDSPLSPFGSEVQIRVGLAFSGGFQELLSLGWYRIETAEPHSTYRRYRRRDGSIVRPFQSVQLTIDGADHLAYVDDARMLAPEQPASLTSVRDEIGRLVQGLIVPGDWEQIADAPIPRSIAYAQSRLDAVTELAAVLGRVPRADPEGSLGLYSLDLGPPVWKISVPDEAVSWSARLTREGLYNAVVATGEADEAIQGVAVESYGPLRWGGPFGMVPFGYASPLLADNAQAQQAAATRLAGLIRDRVLDVVVECAPNPALELGDVITVETETLTLHGAVKALSWPLPLASMTVTISVPRADLWEAA